MRELFLFQLVFYLVLLPVLYLIQRFWFLKAWHGIRKLSAPLARKILQGLWFAAAALLFLVVVDSSKHILPRNIPGNLILSGAMMWFGASALWLAATFFYRIFCRYFLVSPPAGDVALKQVQNPERRLLLRTMGKIGMGLPFIAAAYGAGRERLAYRVDRVEIPVLGLPRSLAGLRITHLSDIHAGDFMPLSEVRRIVDIANKLGGDIAVVTGDFITDHGDPLAGCVHELSRLQAPLGIWGCNGNHEIYAEAEESSERLFRQNGMHLLRQDNRAIPWRGAAFNLIGVDYQVQGKSEIREMLPGMEMLIRRDMPNILLSHNPNSFYRAAECGIQLMLAGHTHGGQVEVEILHRNLNPAAFFTRFIGGPYKLEWDQARSAQNSATRFSSLYVNRGLGTVKLPIRWGVPPEIALLTLVPAQVQ